MKLKTNHHPQGFSSLITVLFTVTILSAIMFALYFMALILTRQSSRLYTTQKAYYIAEGMLFATTQQIQNAAAKGQVWPKDLDYADYVDQTELDGVTITRLIAQEPSDTPGVYHYQIDITAQFLGSTRQISGQFLPNTYLDYQEVEPDL
jgi:hypothetical protein